MNEVVRAPFFGLALMAATTVGIIDPYAGCKWGGVVEKKWHHDISYKEDFRKKFLSGLGVWDNLLYGIEHAQTFYFAYCFQKRGNIKDANKRFIHSQKV